MSEVNPANPNVPLKDGNAITWDELFPPDAAPAAPASQTATTPAQGTQPAVQVPAVQQPATTPATPVISTKTGTVYKTVEDAIKGIEHKDTVIADMRSRMILATGIDPLTGQPAQQAAAPQPQRANYMQDKQRFYNDLVTAAQKNDAEGVWNAQAQLVFDAMAPLTPVLTKIAKQDAVESVSAEIQDFKEFFHSANYKQALSETPELGDAIAAAESDLSHQHRLPGLYKVAYRISQGLRLPEILKAQQVSTPSQPVRQTTAASTLTPATQTNVQPGLYTKEGRKELQARFEASGGADLPLA
jgi:hypothetical protein